MTDFQVLDRVLLRLPASADVEVQTLEGVVAVIGISGVGVRLTGSSVGMGNISDKMGNLQCPPNGGIYVDFPDNNANPAEQVLRKRRVSRLEELRLRRELATTPLPTTNTTTAAAAGTGPGSTSRLEDLRQRRELALLSSSTTRTTTRLEELRQRQELVENTSSSNPADPPKSAFLLQQYPTENSLSPHAKIE